MARREPARALPRGPHRLSRDEVAESQRLRMLTAMTEAVADKGFAKTVVADVVARSGVSRATFYAMFRDKEDCFQAAFAMTAALVAEVLEAGVEELRNDVASTPLEKLERVIHLYVDMLAGAPALARVFLVESYAAGPQAIAQRRASLDRFVDVVAATHDGHPGLIGTDDDQRFIAEMVVSAVSAEVTTIIGIGALDELEDLRARLVRLARRLLPALVDDPGSASGPAGPAGPATAAG